jgi:YaiO family outer membrane protein
MDEGRYMRKILDIMMLIVVISAIPALLIASDEFPQRSMEASLSYDYLTPDSVYNDWKSAEFKYFHRFDPHNTLMTGAGESIRDESFGWLQAALYRDWLSRLSTYTSLTGATQTKWMGNLRFDNDFNFKLGSDYRYIVTLGQTVIYYDKDKIDYLFSVGGILYLPHLILDGRYFINRSDPGSVWSNSERMSIGFGTRGEYWTTIIASTGAQKYMGLGNLGLVNQNVSSVSLNQEIWMNPSGGIKLGIGYLTVKDGYDKYNATIGCFWQLP